MKLRWVVPALLVAAIAAAGLLRSGRRPELPPPVPVVRAPEPAASSAEAPDSLPPDEPLITPAEALDIVARMDRPAGPEPQRQKDGSIHAGDSHFRQHFVPNAVKLDTMKGSLSLALKEIRIGEHPLLPPQSKPVKPELEASGRDIVYARGQIREKYASSGGQVEQIFVLEKSLEPFRSEGDLTITVALKSELKPSLVSVENGDSREQAVEFHHPVGGLALTYGAATAIDAAGRRQGLGYSLEEGTLEMRLGAAFLATAEFPLTIDPLISGLLNIATSSIKSRSDVAFSPAVNTYLVAFDHTVSGGVGDLYCRSVSSTGNLGTQVILDSSADESIRPRIARSNSGLFLIVYQRRTTGGKWQIWGQRVDVSANVPTALGSGFLIHSSTYDNQNPDVGFEVTSGNFYVVWQHTKDAAGDTDIVGRRVGSDGSLPGSVYNHANSTNLEEKPSITGYGPNPVLVTYVARGSAGSPGDIYCFWTDTGTGVGSLAVVSADAADEDMPDVGNTGASDLVSGAAMAYLTWCRKTATGDFDLYAKRVSYSAAGAPVVGAGITVEFNTAEETILPRVDHAQQSGANRFVVAYQVSPFPVPASPATPWEIRTKVFSYTAATMDAPTLVETLSVAVTATIDEINPSVAINVPEMEALASYDYVLSATSRYVRGQRMSIATIPGYEFSQTAGLSTTEGGSYNNFSVRLKTQPTASFTLTFASSATSEGLVSRNFNGPWVASTTMTFTTSNWSSYQYIYILSTDDFIDEDNVNWTVISSPDTVTLDLNYRNLNPSDVACVNVDNDTAGVTINPTTNHLTTEFGGAAGFTLVLNTQPAGSNAVSVTLSTNDLTEGLVSTPTVAATTSLVLTFTTADWNVPRPVSVYGVDDTAADGNIAYTVVTSASSPDPKYSVINPPDVFLTNVDNDQPGVTVSPLPSQSSTLTTTEAGGTTQFMIFLNTTPTADVTISLTSSNTNEGTVSPSSLTFSSATALRPQTVTVTGVNDALDDNNIAYTVITGAAVSTDTGYSGRAVADLSVTNVDDDARSIVVNGYPNYSHYYNTCETGVASFFTVTLATPPTAPVTVTWTTNNTAEVLLYVGVAAPSSSTAVVFTSTDWNIPQTVYLKGQDDLVADGDVFVTISGSASGGDYAGLSRTAYVYNLDNESGNRIVAFPLYYTFVSESGTTRDFFVMLSGNPPSNVTVTLTSQQPDEFLLSTPASPAPSSSKTLTFTPLNGTVPQTVTRVGVDDSIIDGQQWCYAYITATAGPVGWTGLGNYVYGYTLDNDVAGFEVTLPASGDNLNSETDPNNWVTYNVRLTAQPAASVTFPYYAADLTETQVWTGSAWTTSASLTFTTSNWNAFQTWSMRGLNDAIDDRDIPCWVVSGPSSSTDPLFNGINPVDLFGINVDDDTFGITVSPLSLVTAETGTNGSFTVVLTSQPRDGVSVTVASGDTTEGLLSTLLVTTTSQATLSFTTSNWNVAQTVTVVAQDDPNADFNVPYTVTTLPAVSTNDTDYNTFNAGDVAVTNNDNEVANIVVTIPGGSPIVTSENGGSPGTFQVSLGTPPLADVVVSFGTSNGSEALISTGLIPQTSGLSLTFTTSNWNVAQTVNVHGQNDILTDPISAPATNCTIVRGVVSGDPAFAALGPDVNDNVPVRNLDNEPEVSLSITDGSGSETGPDPITYTFTRTGSTGTTLTVGYAQLVIGDMANHPADYSVSPAGFGSIQFASNSLTAVLTITPVNDAVDEVYNPEYIDLNLTGTGDLHTVVTPSYFTTTILDNDVRGVTVTASGGSTVTSENLTTDTFTVVLLTQPVADVQIPVTVPAAFDDEGRITGPGVATPTSTLTLTFTSLNWGTAQTVTVHGRNDPDTDGNITYDILVGPCVSSDGNYSGFNPNDVTVVNNDNEPEMTLAVTDNAGGETGPDTITYTFTRTGDSTGLLTVGYELKVGSTASLADFTVPPPGFGSIQFAANSSTALLVIAPVDDDLDEADPETLSLALNGLGDPHTVVTTSSVSSTIADNDAAGVTVVPDPSVPGTKLVTSENLPSSSFFTVKLNSQPTADVVITILVPAGDPQNEGRVESAGFPGMNTSLTLTFTSINWNTAQTVTVHGQNDTDTDPTGGLANYSVQIGPCASGDGNYSVINPPDMPVENQDNEPELSLSVADSTGAETNTPPQALNTMSYTFTRTGSTGSTLTVGYDQQIFTDSALYPADYSVSTPGYGFITFAANSLTATLIITPVNDLVDEPLTTEYIDLYLTGTGDPHTVATTSLYVTSMTDNDVAQVIVNPATTPATPLNTSENGGSSTFTVVLNSEPIDFVYVPVYTSNSAEGLVSTGLGTPDWLVYLTFSPLDWGTAQTVTITGQNDVDTDGSVGYLIYLDVPFTSDPVYSTIDPPNVDVANADNEPEITVYATFAPASEPGGPGLDGQFTIFRTGSTTSPLTVHFNTTGSTASSGGDYLSISTSTVIPASSDSVNVPIAVNDDLVTEPTESVVVNLAILAGDTYTLLAGSQISASLDILDNDTPGVTVSPSTVFPLPPLTVSENLTTQTFTVVLNTQPTANVTIPLTSTDPTEAEISSGAVPMTSTLNLTFTPANWNTAQTVTIHGKNDPDTDGNWALQIVLGNCVSLDTVYGGVGGVGAINPDDVDVINEDNEPELTLTADTDATETPGNTGSFTLTRTGDSSLPLTVFATITGTAVNGQDYTPFITTPATIPAFALSATIVLTATNDDYDEDDETIIATVDPGPYTIIGPNTRTITITDNDTRGITVAGGPLVTSENTPSSSFFTVILQSAPLETVTIPITVSDVDEGRLTAPGFPTPVTTLTLTFDSLTWNTAQTVTVHGWNDTDTDPTVGPNYTVLVGAASSLDLKYAGFDPADDVAVENQDNEPEVTIVASDPAGAEAPLNDNPGQFTFTRTGNTNTQLDLTVTISAPPPTPGSDYIAIPTPISIPAGSSSVNVPVSVIDDGTASEGDEFLTITLELGSYTRVAPFSATVTITDNDTPGVSVSPTTLSTSENGTTATFTVVLATAPTAPVSIPVTIAAADMDEGLVSTLLSPVPSTQVTLTFNAANFSIPQAVTVHGQNDAITDGTQGYTVVLGTCVSADTGYGGAINPSDVSVTNSDNEPEVTVTVDALPASEAGPTMRQFTITRTGDSSAPLTVNFAVTGTATGGTDYGSIGSSVLLPGNPTPSSSVTINVLPVNDSFDEDNETVIVTLATGSYTIASPSAATMTINDNDTAGVFVTPLTGLSTSENGTTTSFIVVLTSQPTATVTVPLTSLDTTEGLISTGAGTPDTNLTLTFTTADWNVAQFVTVTGRNDPAQDGNVLFTVDTGDPASTDPQYSPPLLTGAMIENVPVTNNDNDPEVTIAAPVAPGNSISETGGSAVFTLTRTGNTGAALTVNFGVGGTATSGADYASLGTSVQFAADSLTATLTVTPIAGVTDENDETVVVTLASGAYTIGAVSSATITIVDDDSAGVAVNAAAGLTTTESGGTATFTVKLNTQPTGTVTIPVATSTAAEGLVSAGGAPSPSLTLTFTSLNWDTAQTVTITGQNDAAADLGVLYSVGVGDPASSDPFYDALGPVATVFVTNQDNEPEVTLTAGDATAVEPGGVPANQGAFTLSRTGSTTGALTVNVSISGGATSGTDYDALSFVIPAGSLSASIMVNPIDDQVAEGPEQVMATVLSGAYTLLSPQAASVTIDDNDTVGFTILPGGTLTTSENGLTATFTVALTSQPAGDVLLPLSSSNTAEGTVSPASLTFTSLNWGTAQTVTVTGVNDPFTDGTASYQILTGDPSTPSAPGSSYDLLNASSVADVSVQNTDNEPEVTVTAADPSATEPGGLVNQGAFSVFRSGATTAALDVVVSIAAGAGTANPGVDYVLIPTTLTIPAGAPYLTVPVDVLNDPIDEDAETVDLTIVAGPSPYTIMSPSSATVTISDDDSAGVLVVQSGGTTVTSENGTTDTFTVVLLTQPTADVTLPLSVSNGEASVSAASLVFTAANWSSAQTVTVTGLNDAVTDPPAAPNFSVVLGLCTSADPKFSGVDPADVPGTNTDNEPEVTVLATDSSATEPGGAGNTGEFTISRTGDTNVSLTVGFGLSGTALSGSDFVPLAPATTVTLGIGAPSTTVTLDPVNNLIREANETVILTLSGGSYTVASPSAATVTILDDDSAGIIVSPASGLTTSEGGATAPFTVVLTSEPTGDVLVPFTSSNPLEALISTGAGTPGTTLTLTFTSLNWGTAQTVTVTGRNDALSDGPGPFTIAAGDPSSAGDSFYDGLTSASVQPVTGTNADNEPEITVTAEALPATEVPLQARTFTVSRTGDSSNPLTVNMLLDAAAPNAATLGTDYTIAPASIPSSSTVVFGANVSSVTVTVTPVDDSQVELSEVVVLSVAPPALPTDYTVFAPSTATMILQDNETGGVNVSAATVATSEAGTTATFTVVLSGQPTVDVQIPLTSSAPGEALLSSADAPLPSSALVLTFTPLNYGTAQTVTVHGQNDTATDPVVPGTANCIIVTGDPVTADPFYDSLTGAGIADVSVENADNEPEVSIAAGDPDAAEPGTDTGAITITRTGNLSQPLNVPFTFTGSTATSAVDYVSLGTGVTFASGTDTVILGLTVLDDSYAEGGETVVVTLTPSPGNYTLMTSVTTLTIADNDAAGFTISSVSGATTESGGAATFTVSLGSQPLDSVSIPLTVTNVDEGLISTGTGTPGPMLTLTFTTASWNIAQVITVTGQNDIVTDGDVTYAIETGKPVSVGDATYNSLLDTDVPDVLVTNQDNEPEITLLVTAGTAAEQGPISATLTFKRTGDPSAGLAVDYSTSGSAGGGDFLDPGPNIPFAAGSDTAILTITPIDDSVQEPTETVVVTLSTGSYTLVGTTSVSIPISDNDTPGISISPSAGLATSEDGDSATFTVVLNSAPTGDVTLSLTSSDIGEGIPSAASLTFTTADWSIPQTVTITGVDDSLIDGPVVYTIVTGALASSDPAYNGVFPPDILVTNSDNDLAGFAITPLAGLATTEAGGTATFTVSLSSVPIGKVTMTLSSSNSGEGTISPSVLTFTPANALSPQTVTITGVDDTVPDGNQLYTIVTAPVSSADPGYNGLNPPDVSVTNTNDDAVGFSILPAATLITNESGTTATFTVALTSTPTADVTLPISTGDATEGLLSSAAFPTTSTTLTLTFTPANWNVPQTVTVTGLPEAGADGGVTYAIVTGAASGGDYAGFDPADLVALNVDNTAPGFTIVPLADLATSETGTTARFQVALNTVPTGTVTLDLSSSDPTEGLISTGAGTPASTLTLTFTTADALTAQTVTITGQDDAIVDGNVQFTIVTAAPVSSDAAYNGSGANPPDVTPVTNSDDDVLLPPTISYSPSLLQFTSNEGGPNPPSQTLTISNAGGIAFDWNASASGFLILGTSSGTLLPGANQAVTVTVNNSGLVGGGYPGTITITSPTAGSNSPQNVPVILTVLPPPPAITILTPASAPASSATSPFTVGGTATNSPTSVTWVNMASGQSGLATGSSPWTVDVPLLPGNNPIAIYGWNAGGYGTASTTVVYTAETNAPTLSTTSVIVTANVADISGIASDLSGVASVTWLNVTTGMSGTTSGPPTSWSASIPLTNGTNTIVFIATDGVGNTGNATVTVGYTAPVDSTAPAILITSPTDEPNYNSLSSPVLLGGTATDLNGIAAVTWLNEGTGGRGTAVGTTNWTASIALVKGNNVIRVTAVDPSGNTSTALILVVFNPPPGDSGPPLVSILTPTVLSTPLAATPMTGTANDNQLLSAVVWINAGTGQSGTAAGLATWSVGGIPLRSGFNPITVFAFDSSGNSASASITVNFEVPPPTPDGTQAGHCGLTGLDALGLLAALWAARRLRRRRPKC